MPFRFPWLVWRSITGELVRLLVVSAMSLVGVIAFAVAVKPLSEGKVGASSAMTFMALAMVPMLQYALPFAGGFAATLAYHRMSADNEGVAAMAGGIGHKRLLVPAALVGLILAIGVGVLSNTLIPRLFHSMERVLTRDAAALVVSAVEDGQSVVLGERKRAHWQVFAREALRLAPQGDARDHLVLNDVLAVDVARDGAASNYISAERVDAWFFDDDTTEEPGTAVQLRFSNALRTGDDGSVFQEAFVTQRVRIPGAIRDDPKFLTWTQMDEAHEHPEQVGPVEQRRRALAHALADLDTALRVSSALRDEGVIEFRSRQGQTVRLWDGRVVWDGAAGAWAIQPPDLTSATGVPATGRLRIERLGEPGAASGGATMMTSGRAFLEPDAESSVPGAVRLVLSDVLTAGRPGEPGARRDALEIPGLTPVGGAGAAAIGMTADALLDEARRVQTGPDAEHPAVAPVREASRDLRRKIRDFRREIMSKRHERLGYAAACFVMVLGGAVIGMRLRDSLPLPVYLWSFFPALIAVITVSAGQGVAHRTGAAGLILLWGGVAGLAVYTFLEYRKLRAH